MSTRNLLLSVAPATGALALCRWLTRHGARILAYHGVDDRDEPLLNFDGFHVRPEVFERHLLTLERHFHVMRLRELAERFASGDAPPPGAVAITFDDGYLNNLTQAAPLLEKHGMTATFFLTTGFVDGTHQPWWFRLRAQVAADGLGGEEARGQIIRSEARLKRLPARDRELELAGCPVAAGAYPMLDWSGVGELLKGGHDIGAHTVSHISMNHETVEDVKREVAGSLSRIEEKTGLRPALYSYPYGERVHQNEAIAQLVRDGGCRCGVTTEEGFNPRGSDPFLLRRLSITGNHQGTAFDALVSGLKELARRRAVAGVRAGGGC